MVKVYLVSFATPEFYESQERLNKSVLKLGVDGAFPYTMEMIKKTDFYKENKELLDKKQRVGFAVWKPYIISEAMKKINYGDILIYCDSGISLKSSLNRFIEICKKEGIVLFESSPVMKQWTKRDCFILMGADEEKYHNAKQIMGGLNLWKKTKISEKIVSEWLEFCKDERIIGDMSNQCGYPNYPEFIEHRWDQSVLSILAVKYSKHIKRLDDVKDCIWEVHRKRKRGFVRNIIFRIKIRIPTSIKDRVKWFINHHIRK